MENKTKEKIVNKVTIPDCVKNWDIYIKLDLKVEE